MFWFVPATCGAGSPDTCVALAQLASVMVLVEYRMSYVVAVPVFPSSPGAVQLTVMLLLVGLLVARFVTAAGGVVSLPALSLMTSFGRRVVSVVSSQA